MSRSKSVFLYLFYVLLLTFEISLFIYQFFLFLVMDNQDNLPNLRSVLSSDLNDLRPLHVQGQGSSQQDANNLSGTNLVPTYEPSIFADFKKELASLTGMFKSFIERAESTQTKESTDKVQSDSLRRTKNSDDISVCQSHDSFVEHGIVSRKRCYTEALSSVHDMDVLSSKRKSFDNGLDVESLFASKQNSHASEGSRCPIDMENEVLEFVETELPVVFTEKKGKALDSAKLAEKLKLQWQNPSLKTVAKVFSKHEHPENLESIMVPPMPKVILKMPNFKDAVAVREKKLYNIQHAIVKSSHIMASIADDLISAEKSDKPVDTKNVVLKAFDSLSVLANANVNVSNMRKANIKYILNKDVRGLCEPSHEVSTHLFGDELEIRLKEEKEAKRLAVTARSNFEPSRGRTSYQHQNFSSRPHQTRAQNSFLEKGHKSFQFRRKQRPYRR